MPLGNCFAANHLVPPPGHALSLCTLLLVPASFPVLSAQYLPGCPSWTLYPMPGAMLNTTPGGVQVGTIVPTLWINKQLLRKLALVRSRCPAANNPGLATPKHELLPAGSSAPMAKVPRQSQLCILQSFVSSTVNDAVQQVRPSFLHCTGEKTKTCRA